MCEWGRRETTEEGPRRVREVERSGFETIKAAGAWAGWVLAGVTSGRLREGRRL